MTAAITAAGVAVVGGAIIANQQAKSAQAAANKQSQAASQGIEFSREQLAEQQRQWDQQMLEYQRKQRLMEDQFAQTQTLLAPYMQTGQSALYQMAALTGLAAPQMATPGVQGPAPVSPLASRTGTAVTQAQPQTGFGSPIAKAVGQIAGTMAPRTTGGLTNISPAAQEFQKGGLSLSSSKWAKVAPGASPRKEAADMLAQVRSEMPNATAGEQQQEAINRLNAQQQSFDEQSYIEASAARMPTIEAAANPYAGMTGAEAQQAAIQGITQSPLLQELTRQGEEALLQQAAATGGVRGGNIQGIMARYRPQMIQAEIDKQYARLQGLAGAGQSAILSQPTTPQASGYPGMLGESTTIPNLYAQQGQASAQNILAQQGAQNQMWQNIGNVVGWGLEKYGGTTSPFSKTTTTTPATTTTTGGISFT